MNWILISFLSGIIFPVIFTFITRPKHGRVRRLASFIISALVCYLAIRLFVYSIHVKDLVDYAECLKTNDSCQAAVYEKADRVIAGWLGLFFSFCYAACLQIGWNIFHKHGLKKIIKPPYPKIGGWTLLSCFIFIAIPALTFLTFFTSLIPIALIARIFE